MTDLANWIWIVDKKGMTCRNAENNVTVKMETEDGKTSGKIQYMPMELFGEIAGIRDGEKIIEQIVRMAEAEFMAARTQHPGP